MWWVLPWLLFPVCARALGCHERSPLSIHTDKLNAFQSLIIIFNLCLPLMSTVGQAGMFRPLFVLLCSRIHPVRWSHQAARDMQILCLANFQGYTGRRMKALRKGNQERLRQVFVARSLFLARQENHLHSHPRQCLGKVPVQDVIGTTWWVVANRDSLDTHSWNVIIVFNKHPSSGRESSVVLSLTRDGQVVVGLTCLGRSQEEQKLKCRTKRFN